MQVLFCLFHNHSKNQWHPTLWCSSLSNPKMTPAIFIAPRTLHTHLMRRAWMRQRRLINYSAAIHVTVIIPAHSAGLMIAAGAGSLQGVQGEIMPHLWLQYYGSSVTLVGMETGSLNFINMHSCHIIAIDIFVLPSCSAQPASRRWRNFFFLLTNA